VRIGFNLLVVSGDVTVEHAPVLETLKALGYDGVEIPVFGGDLKRYRDLGRLLADLGLAATSVSIMEPDSNPLSDDRTVRERARDRHRWAIDCTAALGGTVIGGPLHSPVGLFTGAGPTETELARCVEAMHAIADYAAPAGVAISVEAINRFECYAMTTMAQASEIYRRVGHPNYGYMFDTFHANIEEQDPVGAYERHHREINHYHISENDRGIPGRGHVPFAAHFDAIRRCGYDGWLTVEAFGRALPSLAGATRVWRDLFPDMDTLFAESIQMIRRHWDEAGERVLSERRPA
jgi:D-psicose/D-tagatose/L-ribulose 3-epimerase